MDVGARHPVPSDVRFDSWPWDPADQQAKTGRPQGGLQHAGAVSVAEWIQKSQQVVDCQKGWDLEGAVLWQKGWLWLWWLRFVICCDAYKNFDIYSTGSGLSIEWWSHLPWRCFLRAVCITAHVLNIHINKQPILFSSFSLHHHFHRCLAFIRRVNPIQGNDSPIHRTIWVFPKIGAPLNHPWWTVYSNRM